MSPTWDSAAPVQTAPIGLAGWLRAGLRAIPLVGLLVLSLGLLLLVRLVERPLFGLARPWTPWITQSVCRMAFVILGMGYRVRGAPMRGQGAVVANHSSWLDIFALNARKRVYFVSKSEVAGWPFIGWLARATGTVFITRDAREARAQTELFRSRLSAGHKLLFFPEGTSTDGRQVLPFKPTLFAAFFDDSLRETLQVQPVTVIYRAPDGEDARFYGWWGGMGFGPHLLRTLAARRPGGVELVYHPPVAVAGFADRKALARHCEAEVRGALQAAL